MAQIQSSSTDREVKGWGYYIWPVSIVSFFVVLAVVYGFFILPIAFSGRPEAIEEKPYQAGLVYQDTIEKLQAGRQFDVNFTFGPLQKNGIRNTQIDVHGDARVQEIIVQTRFPSTKEFDRQVTVAREEGEFIVPLLLPKDGLWFFDISLKVKDTQSEVLLQRKIFVTS